MPNLKFSIITLFPEALEPYLNSSMMWKAQDKGIAEFELINLRDFGLGPHKSVDDTPYGGGDGMLLRCEPVFSAVESIKAKDPEVKVILPTPVGEVWSQRLARLFASGEVGGFAEDPELRRGRARDTRDGGMSRRASTKRQRPQRAPHYAIICPHYEGYDERILSLVDFKISLGNFVLTGGELPALVLVDSIVRLLPGVLGGETSAEIESFSDGNNLEYPQYTKPADFRGMKVPDVLLSGHHENIQKWRNDHSGSVA